MMKHIENEFNKRFKDKKLSNEGFDSDDLWDSISKDLKQKPTRSEDKKDGAGAWWALFGLLLLSCSIAFYMYEKPTKMAKMKEKTSNLTENAPTITAEISKKHAEGVLEKAAPTKSEKSHSAELLPNKNGFEEKKKGSLYTQSRSSFSKKKRVQTATELRDEILAARFFNLEADGPSKSTILQKENVLFENNISAAHSAVTSIEERQKNTRPTLGSAAGIEHIKNLGFALIPSNIIPFQAKPIHAIPFTPAYIYEEPKMKSAANQCFFSFETGLNTLAFNYASAANPDISNMKNEAEKLQLGSSFGVHAGLLFKNKWTVQSGVEYHQFWSKFDIELEKNVKINKSNQLLKVWLEAGTQDTIGKEYGAITVDGVETQRVVHFNRYKQVSIPLDIGLLQQHKKVLYGVSVGAVLNFTTAQSGRTLDNTIEIVDFEHKTPESTLKTTNIGFRISPLLGYQLANHLAVYARPQWTLQSNTGLFGSDMKVGVQQFNLHVGLRYSLR